MALVSDGYTLTVTVKDNGLNPSTMSYDLVAADATAAEAAVTAILALIPPVTNAAISGYSLSQRFVEDNFIVPVSGIHVENRAAIVTQIADNITKKATVFIPAAAPGIFRAASGDASNDVDPADADLVAYINIWQETGALATISDGEFVSDTDPIVRGYRTHRSSKRG